MKEVEEITYKAGHKTSCFSNTYNPNKTVISWDVKPKIIFFIYLKIVLTIPYNFDKLRLSNRKELRYQ